MNLPTRDAAAPVDDGPLGPEPSAAPNGSVRRRRPLDRAPYPASTR